MTRRWVGGHEIFKVPTPPSMFFFSVTFIRLIDVFYLADLLHIFFSPPEIFNKILISAMQMFIVKWCVRKSRRL